MKFHEHRPFVVERLIASVEEPVMRPDAINRSTTKEERLPDFDCELISSKNKTGCGNHTTLALFPFYNQLIALL